MRRRNRGLKLLIQWAVDTSWCVAFECLCTCACEVIGVCAMDAWRGDFLFYASRFFSCGENEQQLAITYDIKRTHTQTHKGEKEERGDS